MSWIFDLIAVVAVIGGTAWNYRAICRNRRCLNARLHDVNQVLQDRNAAAVIIQQAHAGQAPRRHLRLLESDDVSGYVLLIPKPDQDDDQAAASRS